MFKFIYLLIFSFLLSQSLAATLPTSPSVPIPSLETTRNIDTVLSEQAQTRIRKTPILKNQAVTAGSYQQVITLEGSVDSKEQEAAAIAAVKTLKGVKEVKSHLTIKLNPTKE